MAIDNDSALYIMGDMKDPRLRPSLVAKLRNATNATIQALQGREPKSVIRLAINYGGHQQIVLAAQHLAEAGLYGELAPQDITKETVQHYIANGCNDNEGFPSAPAIPDPDSVARTGGDQRNSGFLTWSVSYSEWYYTDTLLPDCDNRCLYKSLLYYAGSDRRFGCDPAKEYESTV